MFEVLRKKHEEVHADNTTMRYYTDMKSHRTSGGYESSGAARVESRGSSKVQETFSTPQRSFSQRFTPSRSRVSAVSELGDGEDSEDLEPGIPEQDDVFSGEDSVFLGALQGDRSTGPPRDSQMVPMQPKP